MEPFWFFRLRFRRAYDSTCDSDFWFSLGRKRSYDFDYDSDSDSVASENQPSDPQVMRQLKRSREIQHADHFFFFLATKYTFVTSPVLGWLQLSDHFHRALAMHAAFSENRIICASKKLLVYSRLKRRYQMNLSRESKSHFKNVWAIFSRHNFRNDFFLMK